MPEKSSEKQAEATTSLEDPESKNSNGTVRFGNPDFFFILSISSFTLGMYANWYGLPALLVALVSSIAGCIVGLVHWNRLSTWQRIMAASNLCLALVLLFLFIPAF